MIGDFEVGMAAFGGVTAVAPGAVTGNFLIFRG